ncbi:hypothetical protein [Nonomuraea jabiensis]
MLSDRLPVRRWWATSPPGGNTVRLTAAMAGGCPNLDHLEVVQ